MDNIVIKVRDILGDGYKFIPDDAQDYITSKIFALQYANIDSTSLLVYKNGVLWANTNYSYSSTTGKVTVTGTLVVGNVLLFTYNAYERYSDTELQGYVRSALYHLTAGQYKTFTIRPPTFIFPTPTESEESLIAIVATILMKGSIKQYRTPEITITFEENLSVDEKINRAINLYKKSYGVYTYVDPTDEPAEIDDE